MNRQRAAGNGIAVIPPVHADYSGAAYAEPVRNRLTFSGIHHADELKTWVRGEQSPLPDWIINNIARWLNRGGQETAGDKWKNA
jgi:hypothetical protein